MNLQTEWMRKEERMEGKKWSPPSKQWLHIARDRKLAKSWGNPITILQTYFFKGARSFSFPLKHPTTQWFLFYFLQPHRTNSFLLVGDSPKNISNIPFSRSRLIIASPFNCFSRKVTFPSPHYPGFSPWLFLYLPPLFDVSPTSSTRTECFQSLG